MAERLGYRPELDGLRALAVLAVVAFHLELLHVVGGWAGVSIFFVLSGYLITSLLVSEIDRTRRVDIRGFYVRRARRLIPAVVALVVVVLAVVAVAEPEHLGANVLGATSALGYVNNWATIATGDRVGLFSHLWSLSVEEQFYLVWPFIVSCAVRRGGPALLQRLLIGVTALGVAMCIGSWLAGMWRWTIYAGTFTHGAILLSIGGLVAVVRPTFPRWVPWAGGVVLLVVAFAVSSASPAIYLTGFLLVGIPAAAIVGRTPAVMVKVLSSRWLVAIGVRSYGIYLWHHPVHHFLKEWVDTSSRSVLGLLTVAVTMVFVEVSYRFVEQPFRKARHPRPVVEPAYS